MATREAVAQHGASLVLLLIHPPPKTDPRLRRSFVFGSVFKKTRKKQVRKMKAPETRRAAILLSFK
jgi:hypothetical protein